MKRSPKAVGVHVKHIAHVVVYQFISETIIVAPSVDLQRRRSDRFLTPSVDLTLANEIPITFSFPRVGFRAVSVLNAWHGFTIASFDSRD